MFRVIINDHKIKQFLNVNTDELVEIDEIIDTTKLFHNETFVIDESKRVVLTSSPTRTNEIPAVLCLKNNRTYGKQGNRHLYKCVPDDKHLPPFLVAYEMKHVGFSKVFPNKYVLIQFMNWSELNPRGMLTNVIGDVDVLDNYYEYQLHCKSLSDSIQHFSKRVASSLIDIIHPQYIPCDDRTSLKTITIDPSGTKDFDDAFSVFSVSEHLLRVSIHIANVSACLDAYQLWDHVSRVATIYLPNKNKPMLPPRLSEYDCSLVSGKSRIAFTMDIIVNMTTGTVVDTTFQNTKICVARNYVYDEPELLVNNTYRTLLGVTNKLQPCADSHEVVAYWMGQMNIRVAEVMYQRKTGIFRRATFTETDILPESVKHWKNSVCDYVVYEEESEIRHEPLNVDKYLHITSPIRRLVDLLNMTQFQLLMGVPFSFSAHQFYINWSHRIDYLNEKMRMIRQVQTQCSLLSLCSKDSLICDGYVLEKVITNNQTNIFNVYLKPLNLMYSFKTTNTNIELNRTYSFKIITFQDEDHFKRKVRLQLI